MPDRGDVRVRRRGATLIEVMVAALILATLAIAGGALLYRARASLYQERNLRAATDAATGLLEKLRAAAYEQIKPPVNDFDVHFLSESNWVWTHHGGSDPGETATRNGRVFLLTTTVRFADLDEGQADSYDYLLATVDARYGDDARTGVRMETRLAP